MFQHEVPTHRRLLFPWELFLTLMVDWHLCQLTFVII